MADSGIAPVAVDLRPAHLACDGAAASSWREKGESAFSPLRSYGANPDKRIGAGGLPPPSTPPTTPLRPCGANPDKGIGTGGPLTQMAVDGALRGYVTPAP